MVVVVVSVGNGEGGEGGGSLRLEEGEESWKKFPSASEAVGRTGGKLQDWSSSPSSSSSWGLLFHLNKYNTFLRHLFPPFFGNLRRWRVVVEALSLRDLALPVGSWLLLLLLLLSTVLLLLAPMLLLLLLLCSL